MHFAFRNEADVGRAVKKSGLRREELFVITKLAEEQHGRENVLPACKESLER